MNVKKVYPTSYRNPKCSRCRNHGFDAKMKGHKGFCPYILCNCLKCILVEERRRISRQQILLQRHPDINVKDIFKGCIRCEKFCQQVTDYSNCVTADSFMSSPSTYPVQQINANPAIPSVNLPLNLQMPSTQPPPGHIYSSSPQPDFSYYTPKMPFAASNCPTATSSKMSDIHNGNSNISSSSISNSNSSSSSSTTTTTTSATNNAIYCASPQMATNGMTSSEFGPSYIYQSNSYQLARAPQNIGFGNYNRPSLFWNTFNYPMNSWSQKFCDNSVASSTNKMQIPENLSFKSPDNSMESCKLAADTTK